MMLFTRGWRRISAGPRRALTRARMRRTGSFVVSYPKAGRTWLRLMLATLLADLTGRPLTLDVDRYGDSRRGIPHIFFTHDGAGLSKPGRMDGDKSFYRGKPVLLLVRDPRDILVSHYFQITRRKRRGPAVPDLDMFLRGPLGIDRVIAFMNGWADQRTVPGRFAVLTYEQMHQDTVGALRSTVEFFRVPNATDDRLRSAADSGVFARMQQMEADGVLDDWRLRPRDAGDPDSFKVRRGRVGGYRDDLTPEQIRYLDERIRRELSAVFSVYW